MANSKLTDFTEDTAPLGTDMVYTVHDPAGTPGDRKTKVRSLATGLHADRGLWVASTVYNPGDLVTYGSCRFLRLGATFTSAATFDPANWVPLDRLDVDNPATWTAATADDYEFDATGSSLPTGWSWVNQGGATYGERNGAGIFGLIASDGSNLRMLTKALPAASVWTATLCMSEGIASSAGGDVTFYGIVLREAATAKNVMIRKASVSGPIVSASTSNTFGGAANVGGSGVAGVASGKVAFKIKRNSATSYDFYFSADGGVSFETLALAYNVTANFTTAPDQIGVLCNNNVANAAEFAAHWLRVR